MTERDIDETGAPAPEPTPVVDDPAADPVTALQRERDELLDRLLRKTAEFDNYRKRVDRERREQAEWAAADLLADVLAIADDFERALAAEAPPEAEAWKAGLDLIHRQLQDLLKKRGVTPIEAVGADFDPHLHQAVAYDETPGAREGEVVAELRRGYRLGDRLLRPSMVKVAKAS
ncbi:MAG: nucleotide exchange factor GrpE [Vicinamibacterales bacterium]|nr:nucleotide exchange factor GrpE [Vicinamibacterales bacterium]